MAFVGSPPPQSIARRRFLQAGIGGVAAFALYSGEVERHWLQTTQHDVLLPGLSPAFDAMRIVQISDIHLDEFTEPFFLRRIVDRVNRLTPDAVFLTGDYVTYGFAPRHFAIGAAWQCANILDTLHCKQRYAILGNHDLMVGAPAVIAALTANGITVLRNACLPIQRAGARFWLAGLDDAVEGHPKPELAIPPSIRNLPNEPVVLLCHAPDYVDRLLSHPTGKAVSLMLSGHTHGGQIRFPFLGALALPPLGKRYVEGWFRFGDLQLYVNRGIGTVELPLRLDCPPELTIFTLRST